MSKFASLTAGLLARKGEAEPTSTPFAEQLLTRVGAPASDIRALTPMHAHAQPHPHVHAHVEPGALPKEAGLKVHVGTKAGDTYTSVFGTFGRRSVQDQAKPPHPPALSIVPHEEEEHGESHCGSCTGLGADDAGKTYHVNLRLKRLRFVKLKLSAALMRRPVQDIVSEALDQWFEKLPGDVMGDCACLKARAE